MEAFDSPGRDYIVHDTHVDLIPLVPDGIHRVGGRWFKGRVDKGVIGCIKICTLIKPYFALTRLGG